MTSLYKCEYVITGNSANKGPFREEHSVSIRRKDAEPRSLESLREEITQGAIDYIYEHEHTPWRPDPKYTDVTNLKVELGEIKVVGD